MLAPFSSYPVNEAYQRLIAQDRTIQAARAQGAACAADDGQPRIGRLQRLLDWLCGIDSHAENPA
jgi:hypothetical protein